MWFSASLSALWLATLALAAVRTDEEGNTIKSIGVWLLHRMDLFIGVTNG
jgi:hypothetical protein